MLDTKFHFPSWCKLGTLEARGTVLPWLRDGLLVIPPLLLICRMTFHVLFNLLRPSIILQKIQREYITPQGTDYSERMKQYTGKHIQELSVCLSLPSFCYFSSLPEAPPSRQALIFLVIFPPTGFPNFSLSCTKFAICGVFEYQSHYYLVNIFFIDSLLKFKLVYLKRKNVHRYM